MEINIVGAILSSNKRDIASFTGASIYDNSDDAVIIYGIQHWGGDQVFNQFVPNLVARTGAVMPDPNTSNGLPALQAKFDISSFNSKLRNSGKKTSKSFSRCIGFPTMARIRTSLATSTGFPLLSCRRLVMALRYIIWSGTLATRQSKSGIYLPVIQSGRQLFSQGGCNRKVDQFR